MNNKQINLNDYTDEDIVCLAGRICHDSGIISEDNILEVTRWILDVATQLSLISMLGNNSLKISKCLGNGEFLFSPNNQDVEKCLGNGEFLFSPNNQDVEEKTTPESDNFYLIPPENGTSKIWEQISEIIENNDKKNF